MTKNLYMDIHVLQTVPSSNINRDDTGAPKTAIYGGATRSRVSSQSWKKAIRDEFKADQKDEWLQSCRTKRVVYLLANELKALDDNLDEEASFKKSKEIIETAGIKLKKDKKSGEELTGALLLVSKGQLEKLAKYALENDELDKKELKNALLNENSLDLALFGRMVADDPSLNVDASCQVAHAISTHEVTPEFDFYTAVEDEQKEDNAGSAMLGTIDYNSSTLYRYANINLNELAHNLDDNLAVKGAGLFIKEFATSMPTGHQNSFANKTLPKYIMIQVRQDTPINLVSAFEDAVRSRKGYMDESIKRLEDEGKKIEKMVLDEDKPLLTIVLTTENSEIDNQADNLSDLIEKVTNELTKALENENTND
ncbi:type I-E CRISPR-associated protein Cas7/Cse4/CasC [Lactobacillus agrestimuris]|uniref:type I-E CRISPR-associated protein Cas7/Cse4/CasC n=1 Tax=Lactobacillus agrestimuris TaxID=2941328 RepID=UPI002043C4AF|nr:type I-E CRISPR-associated protein Cas7/Cse4/CasC [Lactobacillus agrestimuris]